MILVIFFNITVDTVDVQFVDIVSFLLLSHNQ